MEQNVIAIGGVMCCAAELTLLSMIRMCDVVVTDAGHCGAS